MSQKYQWKQPLGGKTLTWRPLTGGDLMDLDTNYANPSAAPLKPYAQYAMRIASFEGMPPGQVFQPQDFRSWDELDIQAFMAEVDAKDALRLSAINGDTNSNVVARVEKALLALLESSKKMAAEAQIALSAIRAAEAKTGPLKVSDSPAA